MPNRRVVLVGLIAATLVTASVAAQQRGAPASS